jgi:hypothetical protein
MTQSRTTTRYERRALLRAAVLGTDRPPAIASAGTVVTGVLAKVGAQAIAVQTQAGEQLLTLSPSTVTWLGARATPSALRTGDPVIVRRRPHHASTDGWTAGVAERIWAGIGRVTGTIVDGHGREFLVDTGRPGRAREPVIIAEASLSQIRVRFPMLAPGYLLDVIGTRHRGYLLAVTPATAQPPYPTGHPPAALAGGVITDPVSGTAVWHEPDDEHGGRLGGQLGLEYPALDPETESAAAEHDHRCVRLPYLSLGSVVRVRNECTRRDAVLPVTGGGGLAGQFCDRCTSCGTSPRGRVADLTMAAFVELGGDLEKGCFNATLTMAD